MELDTKSRQILYFLDYNARQPASAIAKQVGLSKQVVHYRLERIFKDKLIEKCLAIFDLSQLGLILHKAYFRFQNTNFEREKKIIDFLRNHKYVSWLVSSEGRFDIAVAFHTPNIIELDKTLTEIENKFGKYFAERIVNTVISTNFFMRDYLVSKEKRLQRPTPSFHTVPKKARLNKNDYLTLAALAKNSRYDIKKISNLINQTEDAVRKRIKKLEKEGVIKEHVIVPNTENINVSHYKILIHLHNYTEIREKQFIQFCQNNPHIFFMNKNIGGWEMEIDMEVESTNDFRNTMREVKNEFSDIIKDFFTLNIFKVHKFHFLPTLENKTK